MAHIPQAVSGWGSYVTHKMCSKTAISVQLKNNHAIKEINRTIKEINRVTGLVFRWNVASAS